jgi:hypothetical protein
MTNTCFYCRLIRFTAVLLLILGFLAIEGCSAKSKINVSGKVSYKGQPVRPGYVQFFDSRGTILSSADLDADGTFTATDVPPGEVQVAVRLLPGIAVPKKNGDSVDGTGPVGKSAPIPLKYKDPKTSGLRYTINAGTNHLDIELH